MAGRKLQYRRYCVWRGQGATYAGAMAQVCALPYAPPSGDMAPEQHVTNVSCNVDSSNFVPERPVQDLRQSHPEAFEAVVTALRSLSRACAPALAPSSNRFELVGWRAARGGEIIEGAPHRVRCPRTHVALLIMDRWRRSTTTS